MAIHRHAQTVPWHGTVTIPMLEAPLFSRSATMVQTMGAVTRSDNIDIARHRLLVYNVKRVLHGVLYPKVHVNGFKK